MYRIPLHASTIDQRPVGMTKWFASRNTGTPDQRNAPTVKSAVQSMSVGTRISPTGTANSRNARGNASARPTLSPTIVTIEAWTMKASANCLSPSTSPTDVTNHSAPARNTSARPGHQGVAGICASASRRRHVSQRHIGTTTKPCAKVSERHQMATMEAAVDQ